MGRVPLAVGAGCMGLAQLLFALPGSVLAPKGPGTYTALIVASPATARRASLVAPGGSSPLFRRLVGGARAVVASRAGVAV